MISLYLISKGIPKQSIYILDRYPNSTYQNVIMVKESLDENNIKSILFVTAPYHSRRAVLTWGKNAPNINIIAPDTTGSLSKDIRWGIGFDKMRIIVYEYVAIAYNWLVGRI